MAGSDCGPAPGDYIKHNEIEAKTYYLEKNNGWQGLIVDPHPGDYIKHNEM